MFCQKCGSQIEDGAKMCPNCQSAVVQGQSVMQQQYVQQTHQVPKCTCCGYTGEMKAGPLLTTNDWIWFFYVALPRRCRIYFPCIQSNNALRPEKTRKNLSQLWLKKYDYIRVLIKNARPGRVFFIHKERVFICLNLCLQKVS